MDYLPANKTLRITYTSGMVYDYKAVPEAVYHEMQAAPSKGQFLNFYVKGKYRYKKVKAV